MWRSHRNEWQNKTAPLERSVTSKREDNANKWKNLSRGCHWLCGSRQRKFESLFQSIRYAQSPCNWQTKQSRLYNNIRNWPLSMDGQVVTRDKPCREIFHRGFLLLLQKERFNSWFRGLFSVSLFQSVGPTVTVFHRIITSCKTKENHDHNGTLFYLKPGLWRTSLHHHTGP